MLVLILAAAAAAFGLPGARKRPVMTLTGVAHAARFAGLFFGGLFAGLLLAVLVLGPALGPALDLVGLDVLAAATLLPALAATAVLVVADRTRRPAFRLTLTALVLLALACAISVAIALPITTDHGQQSHIARTGAAVLALGCLCAAALVPNAGTPPRTTPARAPG